MEELRKLRELQVAKVESKSEVIREKVEKEYKKKKKFEKKEYREEKE